MEEDFGTDFSEPFKESKGEKASKEKPEKKSKREELVIEAKNFFDFSKKEFAEARKKGTNVLFLNFMNIAEFSEKLSSEILAAPEETIILMEIAVEESGLAEKPRIRLTNLPESQSVKIRNLRSKHLNELIVVEGIIRQSSDVRPQVVNAKFECPSCGTILSVLQIEKKFREPMRCSCGRKGGFTLLSKDMVDTQRLVIEETPESLSGGEQPKRINVFVKEDLVEPKMEEKTTPGSRVKVIGVLKEVPVPLPSGGLSTRFELAIETNNLISMEETYEELDISEEDEKQIIEISQDPHLFDSLAKSIAPGVWGYEEIKKCLILQLFGGVRKVFADGQKKRGDMHILLVGDPGVAKSVTLNFIADMSPKGRYVVGKSASGAGLTATVVRDEYLRGWSLEAGAMVLANKGIVCIDELEKMDPQDRSAMHEAMEQQTITISKANVQATLRSETSVLAAANPKFGRFDPYQPVAQQIDLPPTLINRFDIIFTLRDIPDKDKDQRIAAHVLYEHTRNEASESAIPLSILRKYIAYARQRFKPVLNMEAMKEIEKFYVELRNTPVATEGAMRPIPISARQLEALIRMSEASAKLRLSLTATKEDAKRAIDLMKYYLMQVGYDYESKTFDIDRIGSRITSSQRNKIFVVRDLITELEGKIGKMIPVEEIEKELEGKLGKNEIEDALVELEKQTIIFKPKHGYVQKI